MPRDFAKIQQERDDLQTRLEREYGTSHLSEKKRSLLFFMAWQHGHSCGESEVENYYSEFADLALCE